MANSQSNSTVAPDFIVVGAQRGGTTWMQRRLIDHPETYVPAWRTGSILLTVDDMAGYENEPLVGVFDATLLTRPEMPSDIAALAPNLKLLAVVRNPVERAYSWYHLRLRQGDGIYAEEPTFEQALDLDPDLIANSIYTNHLHRYASVVGEDRLWIGVFDDLRDDPLTFLSNVLEFVGATQTTDLPSQWSESVNYSAVVKNRRLHMLARRAKAGAKRAFGARNQWLVDRIEQSRPVQALKQTNESAVPGLRDETRIRLFEAFADDVTALEQVLDRDLSCWRPAPD